MARDITAGFQTEIEADVLKPAIFIKAEFDGGDVLVWSGVGEKDYNSDTYQGLGEFLSITQVTETQQLQANGLQFTLSGVPSSLISVALNENYQWRPITMWFAVLDADDAIISDPYQVFSGKMDVLEINDNGDTSTLVLNAENDLIVLKTNRERRYTPEDQKRYFSGDLGLDFVPNVADLEIIWGS